MVFAPKSPFVTTYPRLLASFDLGSLLVRQAWSQLAYLVVEMAVLGFSLSKRAEVRNRQFSRKNENFCPFVSICGVHKLEIARKLSGPIKKVTSSRYFGDYEDALSSLLIGKTMAGMRALDVTRGIDLLAARSDVAASWIAATGRAAAALPTLFAALFERPHLEARVGRHARVFR